jgi:hypothetical protein
VTLVGGGSGALPCLAGSIVSTLGPGGPTNSHTRIPSGCIFKLFAMVFAWFPGSGYRRAVRQLAKKWLLGPPAFHPSEDAEAKALLE